MSGLNEFLKKNKKKDEVKKIVASTAFLDEAGKPMEWEIRALKSKEMDALRKQYTTIKKGKEVLVDSASFNAAVAARCTLYPNLNDKELQDSYGVMGAEELITEMLDNAGEYQAYVSAIMTFSGFNQADEELIEEAKN